MKFFLIFLFIINLSLSKMNLFEKTLHKLLKRHHPIDGEWITLQDWSQCTLACGGGKQYFQRQCKPPKYNGKSCQGPAVLERLCNTQKCEIITEDEENILSDKVIVQNQKVSLRPQRYEICELKEEDMNLVNDLEKKNQMNPVRVVMNNHTFTVFQGSSYGSVLQSFDLIYLSVEKPSKDCLQAYDARDHSKSIILCILPFNVKSNKSLQQVRDQWIDDIDLFKFKCHTPTFSQIEMIL